MKRFAPNEQLTKLTLAGAALGLDAEPAQQEMEQRSYRRGW